MVESKTIAAHTILKTTFGYDSFQSNQEQIINHVLQGNDALVLMPTGGGKSICFQIPALIFEGLTIVISPLISLMKDQVEALKANGVKAAFYNSSLTPDEEKMIVDQVLQNELKLLYLSPERLLAIKDSWLGTVNIALVAVDEAHCVSMWGHDFRPEYTQLKAFHEKLADVPFMALTATADKTTRIDIADQLGLNSHETFISSFDRPNLSLDVRPQVPKQVKVNQITTFVNERPNQAGIVYCLSRKNTEELASDLVDAGINATYYHAGIESKERAKVQEDFINDNTQVICATIAFGMGIDKSNVRWVIHNNLPKNIESYYQEIGRAGRDGSPSETILYYNLQDLVLLGKFAAESGQAEILQEKLKRIQQYAEAATCRRKILLAYFGEILEQDCGNCDVCKNPPKFIDGSVLAQKALSALVRLKESVGTNLLINVLRGSRAQEILEKGYDRIKTYGVGAAISFRDWQHYLTQMINLGVMEIAYTEGFVLKSTDFGKMILSGKIKLNLTTPQEQSTKSYAQTPKADLTPDDKLFNQLRRVRKKIADLENVPAYVIFNDSTLYEMVAHKPVSELDMLAISGVGEIKMQNYGAEFIRQIKKFKGRQIGTYELTYQMYTQGLSPDAIAQKRELSETTIFSHLAKLYQEGRTIDLEKFINPEELEMIKKAHQSIKDSSALKPYFEFCEEKLPYHKIRIGLTLMEDKRG